MTQLTYGNLLLLTIWLLSESTGTMRK